MRVMQPLKHVYFIYVSARPKKQDIKACFGTPIQTHKEPWYGTQNSSQSDRSTLASQRNFARHNPFYDWPKGDPLA